MKFIYCWSLALCFYEAINVAINIDKDIAATVFHLGALCIQFSIFCYASLHLRED